MSYKEIYTVEKIMHDQVKENAQRAEARRLARELQLQASQQHWGSRAVRQMGHRLALFLIKMGQRLDQATLPAKVVEG